MRKFFTKEEVDWFIENYPKFGAKYCAEYLSRTLHYTRKKAQLLGIKATHEVTERLRFQAKYAEIEKNFPMRLVGPNFTPFLVLFGRMDT